MGENRIKVQACGPLSCKGDFRIGADGEPVSELSLCRCGDSENKPFCDGAHSKKPFRDTGENKETPNLSKLNHPEPNPAVVKPGKDGPLLVTGEVVIEDATGKTVFAGRGTALCRCGATQNPPFCDGAHLGVGFKSE